MKFEVIARTPEPRREHGRLARIFQVYSGRMPALTWKFAITSIKNQKSARWTAAPAVFAFTAAIMICILFFSSISCKSNIMVQNFEKPRSRMVEEQLKTRNIKSEAVLDAMRSVPRHLFVPEDLQNHAYADRPLPIGLEQTISQPYIVALMTEQLDPVPGMKILEIGTGSGYQAAILAHLGCEVYTIELLEELAARSKKILAGLNFNNVSVKHGNGYLGWPEEAPFDAVIVTASPDRIPEKLIEQLKEGGKMIIPVGRAGSVQSLKLIVKENNRVIEKDLIQVMFVPMVDTR